METINHEFILKGGVKLENRAKDRYRAKDTPSAAYCDIFDDLSGYKFDDSIDLSGLNISSLKGVPAYILQGFQIDLAKELRDLEGCPKVVADYFSVERCNNLTTLKGISDLKITTGDNNTGILYLRHNSRLSDISDLSEETLDMCQLVYLSGSPVLAADIVKKMKSKRRANGSWNFLDSNHEELELEKIYSVYEKVGFNSEKLNRVFELL